MNPMDVLAPNYLGDSLENTGIDELTRNSGLGVPEASLANEAASQKSNPAAMKDSLRTAKAREFGKTKETIGF